MTSQPQLIGVSSKPSDRHPVFGPCRYYESIGEFTVPEVESSVNVAVANTYAFPIGMTVYISNAVNTAFLMITDVDHINKTIELENYGSIYNAQEGTVLYGLVYIVLFGPKVDEVVR